MSEQVRVDTAAVAALAGELDALGTAVQGVGNRVAEPHVGPASVGPALRDHAVAYVEGMRRVHAEIGAMAQSVDHLADGLSTAARVLDATDGASRAGIEAAGRPT